MRVSYKRLLLVTVVCPIVFIVWSQWSLPNLSISKTPRDTVDQSSVILWTTGQRLRQTQTDGLNSSLLKGKDKGSKNPSLNKKPNFSKPVATQGKLTAHRQRYGKIFSVSGRVQLDLTFPKHAPIPLTVTSGYMIPNSHICASSPNLLYVVIVHSSPNHFDRRQSMRQTWANQNLSTSTTSRTVFLLGKRPDYSLQRAIVMENQKYGDIVQGDFIDSYKNLTLKAVMGLRWVTENCHNVRFVVKVDDDVFVNIFQVKRNYFPVLDKNPLQIICQADFYSPIVRHTYEKSIVPAEYFQQFSYFPMPICHGFVVFYSVQLAEKLFEKAKTTPFFLLDDVHVYGILAAQIPNITWRDERRKFSILEEFTARALHWKDLSRLLAGTVRSRDLMNKLWTFAARDQYEGNNKNV